MSQPTTGPLSLFRTSIGKKQLMAITGLLLCGFLLAHLAGNILIVISADAFNLYAYKLTSTPLIYFAEAMLAALFLAHLFLGLSLAYENRQARPVRYAAYKKSGKGGTFASATMPYTGIIILIFLVLHLLNFKFGSYYETNVDGVQMRDLHRTVLEYFANPTYVSWYVVAMITMGVHLSHGFSSAFQSVGAFSHQYTPKINMIGKFFALFIAFGFSALALYCFFQQQA